MKRITLLLAAALIGCSTSGRAVLEIEGEAKAAFDGRYFHIEGDGKLEMRTEMKDGTLALTPAIVKEGKYEVGYDLKTRKTMYPALAKRFVYPDLE